MEENLLTPAQVAQMTGLTIGALAQLRYIGRGPDFYRLGPRTIRYGRSTVQAWVESSRTTTSAR